MKQANITVMRKTLYAVESGGQVYGKQNYSAFAGVGANTPNEKAITIGAGQWYANEAKRLLTLIKTKYPSDFKKLDTAGISADLEKSWASYGVTKTSAKGKCIIAIISSANGIKCQDSLMDTQIKEYAASIEKTYGSMDDSAMMECINIIHQGGASALKRILAKTQKPYTAKRIYAALNTDPADKSSNNQVGDYVTRQKKVYEFITKYAAEESGAKEDKKVAKTRAKVVALAQSWVGKKESDGSHKSIIDIYNSFTPHPRGYKLQYTDAWCAGTVSALAIYLGYTDIMPVECSCYYLIEQAKKMGIWKEDDAYTPKPADLILYDWQDSGSGDNTGSPDHVGTVEKVSGTTITVIEGNYSDAVKRRTIQVNGRYIRGYICPKYDEDGTSTGTTTNAAAGKKSVSEIAKEVLAGKWGNGDERKKKLQAAGYDYNAVQAEVNKQAKGSGSQSTTSGGGTGGASKPSYKVGSTYTLKVDALKVRSGAGTKYAAKTYSQLTANAKKNAYSNGCLKKGTKVTCQQVKNVGNDIWMKIPSGWIAAYYGGDKYVG